MSTHAEQPAEPTRRNAATLGAPRGAGSRTPKQGATMLGAEAAIASLEAEGVDTVFGYPGGQAIKIYDALYDSQQITHILARHEQGAVHMADGYARSTGRPGVVIVTSGPGATNTVTGIATAYMDSVPLVVITGQVGRGVIGTDSFQESDIVGITMPVVKHSYLLQSTDELTRTIREAFHIASTGRPGPVLIDIPSDLAGAEMVFEYPDEVNLPSYKPTYRGNAKQVRAACRLLEEADQPLLYVGGGIISSEASDELVQLMDLMQVPAVVTLMGKGAVPASHPLNLGPVGMHGAKYSNMAMCEADLIIAAGARFSDRVTGRVSEFAPNAKVVHIDIDPAEIGKIRDADVPIVGDLKGVLAAMLETLQKDGAAPRDDQWIADIAAWRERYPFYHPNVREADDEVVPELVIAELGRQLDPERSIVTTEVGQHQMWAHQFLPREFPRTFLSSGGLGTMGFGFPAAIGAAIANPDKAVVCVAGDGSFQMNSQEMATAAINRVPVKVMIMDNRCLGMVHQWQKLFYDKRYSQTLLEPVPDFVKLAEAYGWEGERVEHAEEVAPAIARMLAAEGPYLLDVAISRDQNVYPMVAPGAALNSIMGAIDVAVGAVRTDMPASAGARVATPMEPADVSSPCAKIDAQFGGRWEIDPDDTGARLGQEGSTVDVPPSEWKTLFRDGAAEKGGDR
nr:biosynthetic-type acetolactate synthase large subunit [uncultured Adlercreutzia sp.]